jgi:hypothetical protein
LFLPAFAEYSVLAILLVPVLFAVAWLLPTNTRRQTIVFALLVVIADEAFRRTAMMTTTSMLVSIVVIVLFLGAVGAIYGRIKNGSLLIMLAVILLANNLFPDGKVEMYAHFMLKAQTEKTYFGEFSQPFPFKAADVNGDGKDELVTIGNTYPTAIPSSIPDFIQKMYKEETKSMPMQPYVFTYNGSALKEIDTTRLNQKTLNLALPRYYTGGFPYYLLDLTSMSMKKVAPSDLFTASLMKTGSAPFMMYTMDVNWLQNQIQDNDGIWDALAKSGNYTHLEIKGGRLTGSYKNQTFDIPTSETRLIGSIKIEGDREALVLQGVKLEIVDPVKNEVLYALDKYAKAGIGKSDISIADLNNNGVDELIIHYPQPLIIEPAGNDTFNVLYGSLSDKFRISDINGKEIIGFDRSLVRNTETLYLGGYTYTNHALKQQWKVFLPTVSQATYADLNGDGHKELVTTFQGDHRIYIWEPHGVPVRELLFALTLLLIGYLIVRRVRHEN